MKTHHAGHNPQRESQGPALWARMAARYDWLVERIVPGAYAFFETCMSFIPNGPLSLLELGSGTGYATEQILCRNPDARVTCLDLSEEMLAAAKAKPALRGIEIAHGDIRDDWPQGRFDVVISTLCLHHLTPAARRRTHQRAFAALTRNGRFINGDIFKPPSRWEEILLRNRWLVRLRSGGLSQRQMDDMIAKRRSNMRHFDTPEEYRASLAAAGFPRVICPWVCETAAVWVAFKGRITAC